MRERISAVLQSFSINPAKRDTALLVALKLGINLDDHQAWSTANSSETSKTDE
jgi:hypothetical protein